MLKSRQAFEPAKLVPAPDMEDKTVAGPEIYSEERIAVMIAKVGPF